MDPIATYFAEARTRAEANDKLEANQPAPSGRRKRNTAASELIRRLKKQQHYAPCNYEPPYPIWDTYQYDIAGTVITTYDLSIWSTRTQYAFDQLNIWRVANGNPPFVENRYYQSVAINQMHYYIAGNGHTSNTSQPGNTWGSTWLERFQKVGCNDVPNQHTLWGAFNDDFEIDNLKNHPDFQNSANTQIGMVKMVASPNSYWVVFVGPTTTTIHSKPPPTKTIWNMLPTPNSPTNDIGPRITIDSLPYHNP